MFKKTCDNCSKLQYESLSGDTEGEGKLTSTLKLVEMGTRAIQLRNLFGRNNKKYSVGRKGKLKLKIAIKTFPNAST